MTARQFAIQLDQEWAGMVEDMHEFVALVGLHALRGVVQKSPVDTGRFKGNWNLTIGAPDQSVSERTDPGGGATIRRGETAASAYAAVEGFPVIYLTNNLPYAARLEDGHSKQAPSGMVGLTVAELEATFSRSRLP